MKRVYLLIPLLALVMLTLSCASSGKGGKFGDAAFIGYQGVQRWPTGNSAQVITDFAVPIYIGLPDRHYEVLGRIYDDRRSGVSIVGRAFAEGLFSERDRQRDVAAQAQSRGADAVLITNDDRVINSLGITKEEMEETTPLFNHKDKVTLAIKFE